MSNSVRFEMNVTVFLDCLGQLGPVFSMQWSPYWTVLAVAWQHRGLGIFSVFGSLLWCSMSDSTR